MAKQGARRQMRARRQARRVFKLRELVRPAGPGPAGSSATAAAWASGSAGAANPPLRHLSVAYGPPIDQRSTLRRARDRDPARRAGNLNDASARGL